MASFLFYFNLTKDEQPPAEVQKPEQIENIIWKCTMKPRAHFTHNGYKIISVVAFLNFFVFFIFYAESGIFDYVLTMGEEYKK